MILMVCNKVGYKFFLRSWFVRFITSADEIEFLL